MNVKEPQNETTAKGWLNRTVLGAGITSGLGDLNYEACNVALPGFLAVLGIPAVALGAMEGLSDALSSFTKLGAGYLADKLGHRKKLVVLGYFLTALMPLLFALANGWALILGARLLGWFGKGIRGPLRDAIMAEAITANNKGKAFGFHRAADTAGAVLGPLLGVTLLASMQNRHPADSAAPFRMVFQLAFIPGLLSVLSFALLVKDDGSVPNRKLQFLATLRQFPASFKQYLKAVGIFGAGDFAHTLLILAATQILTPSLGLAQAAMTAGLLYVWRNIIQTVASFPVGALADKYGHRHLLVLGYFAGVAMTTLLTAVFAVHSHNIGLLVIIFTLAGLCIAIQEALEATLTAQFIEPGVRGTAYGLLATVNGVGDLVSSALVGLLWTGFSPVMAFSYATLAMTAGTIYLARLRD